MHVVERCATPHGEFVLRQHGGDFEMIAGGMFLMATYAGGASERRLVQAALAGVRRPASVLLGGLGLGYSLAAAVAAPGVARIVVVELAAPVLRWHRKHLGRLTGDAWRDPRVELVCADLTRWLEHAGERFDAVCLDVDNGPGWTLLPANAWLYGRAGLQALRRTLAPGGTLAVWSAHAAPAFQARLEQHFAQVEVHAIAVERGEPDRVYLARSPDHV